MKWNEKYDKIGETREKSAFLVVPKTINGETRWGEWAKWEEEYRDDGLTIKTSHEYWKAIQWLN